MIIETMDERNSRLRIEDFHQRTQVGAHAALSLQRQSSLCQTRIDRLNKMHPHWHEPDLHQAMLMLMGLAVLIAAYCIDLLLFSPTSEFVAGWAFKGRAAMQAAKVLVPACIISMESFIGVMVIAAADDAREGASSATMWTWRLLGALCAVVMPAFVIATSMAQLHMDRSVATTYSRPLLLGLAAMAIIFHSVILFSGRVGLQSKAYLLFRHRYKMEHRKREALNRSFERRALLTQRDFVLYTSLLDRHNEGSARVVRAGPMDHETREFLQARFAEGGGTMQPSAPLLSETGQITTTVEPAQAPANPPTTTTTDRRAQSNPAITTQAPEGDNESYYRSLVTQMVRDADVEARP